MKKLIFILLTVLVNTVVIAQTTPTIKTRSDDTFQQVDNYIIALKRLGIPYGPTNTLAAVGPAYNSIKLFYNTTTNKLMVYNPATTTWGIANDIDLANYYTKTESDGRYPISSFAGLANGDIMQYTGTNWVNATVTATAPLQKSGPGAGGTWSITQANTSTSGYLSATDWNTFNNKQAALVSGTNIKSINGNSLLGSGDLTISVSGTTTNPVTFNNSGSGAASGTTFDGSTARTISYNTIGALPLTAGSGNPLTGILTQYHDDLYHSAAAATSTGAIYNYVHNATAHLTIGVEGSAGNLIATGAPAYSAVVGTDNATPLVFATNYNARYVISTSGNHDFKSGTATFGNNVSVIGNGTFSDGTDGLIVGTSSGFGSIKGLTSPYYNLGIDTDGDLVRMRAISTIELQIANSGAQLQVYDGGVTILGELGTQGDIQIPIGHDLVLTDSSNVRWRVKVSTSGVLSTVAY